MLWSLGTRVCSCAKNALLPQANRARTVLIQQMQAFFTGNGIDAFIGPPVNETFMGNVVGLPQMVIPVSFVPVTSTSPRRNPTSVGIYAPPSQDSRVRPLYAAYSFYQKLRGQGHWGMQIKAWQFVQGLVGMSVIAGCTNNNSWSCTSLLFMS